MKTQITFTLTGEEFRQIVGDGIDRSIRYSGPTLYNHQMTAIEQVSPDAWLVVYDPKPEDPPAPPPAAQPAESAKE